MWMEWEEISNQTGGCMCMMRWCCRRQAGAHTKKLVRCEGGREVPVGKCTTLVKCVCEWKGEGVDLS